MTDILYKHNIMTLIESIIARAKSNKQRIVLPESLEERTLTAADMALADEIAEIILIGNPDEIFALAEKLGLKNIGKATIIDPATSDKTAEYANLLYELRKNKGMTPEKAALRFSIRFISVASSSRAEMLTDRSAVRSRQQVRLSDQLFRSSNVLLASHASAVQCL